jgi:hypothetical protein
MTGYKRALGWGTFFGAIFTFGLLIFIIPFYPKRCIVCGKKISFIRESRPKDTMVYETSRKSRTQDSVSYETTDAELPSKSVSQVRDTKKCPVCAEVIKLEAIKCRFCGEKFDPADIARQVAKAKNEDSFENRVLCSDGRCIGVVGSDGRCKECGKPYEN